MVAVAPLHENVVAHPQGDDAEKTEERTTVVFVHKKNAKEVKTALQQSNQLDRTFRMTPALVAPWSEQDCIAIPILPQHDQPILRVTPECDIHHLIQGQGVQCCPFSTAVLGNHTNHTNTITMNISHDPAWSSHNGPPPSLTTVQRALVETLLEVKRITNQQQQQQQEERTSLVSKVLELNMQTCPKKLEKLGDDTLVIPPKALHEDHDATFRALFPMDYFDNGTLLLWKTLARLYNISRVVRRGDIDPDSKIRHSGHRILFPECELNSNGIPVTTGPGSPGWITVTEQGISQSFDLTRVMFSRGNITEKIRFGQALVQTEEVVLDLYAGIGYYTLPALIKGRAKYVYACEWNAEAAACLRTNLVDNGISSDRCTVLEGDCRTSMQLQQQLWNNGIEYGGGVDRVSLGLLPSSEGGWSTAVSCLRNDRGGWLHVHGNVPVSERDAWALWLCSRLLSFAHKNNANHDDGITNMMTTEKEWVAICEHVERVKSFAPKIDHYVADVFVGPPECYSGNATIGPDTRVGLVQPNSDNAKNGTLVVPSCPVDHIPPPSCALSKDGVLHQQWMMEQEISSTDDT